MENLKNNKVIESMEFDKEKFRDQLVKKIKVEEINLLLNSIGQKIVVYELHAKNTLEHTELKKILIFEIQLINHKNIKLILDNFYLFFEKDQPLIFIFNRNSKQFWISFNTNALSNEDAKKVVRKKYFYNKNPIISKKIWKKVMTWDGLSLNSISETYDELSRRIYYHCLNDDDKFSFFEFKKAFDWKYILNISEIKKIRNEIKKLNNLHHKSYNANERHSISQEMVELNDKLKELEKSINDRQIMFNSVK